LLGANATVSAPWKCEGQRAAVSLGDWTAHLDLSQPSAGLHDVRFGEQPLTARIFQIDPREGAAPVEIPVEIIDSYTRGEDLVVTYAETEQLPVRQQVYWRAFTEKSPAGTIAGIDLIISMQTSLLYSDPTLSVVSEFPDGSTTRVIDGGTLILHRLDGLACSIAHCVHPTDCEQAEIIQAESGGAIASYRLFDPGLEKGVIRRARLRTALLPRADDEQQALAAYESLTAAAPPLTT
jgi:hypothetical protein